MAQRIEQHSLLRLLDNLRMILGHLDYNYGLHAQALFSMIWPALAAAEQRKWYLDVDQGFGRILSTVELPSGTGFNT